MRRAAPLLSILARSLRPLRLSKPSPALFATSSTPPPPPLKPSTALTEHELDEINVLIPRLCDAGHHHDAVRLLDACLLVDPPLSALPLPALTASLAALPDMGPAMALLTALRHHPRRPSPIPFCSLLLSSYLAGRRLKEAAKVFAWLCRADSPCRPDPEIYDIVVGGFCRHGRALEAVRTLREMVRDGFVPGPELRAAVYRSLLYEARVDEARELDAAMGRAMESGDWMRDVGDLLDRLIRNWEQ